MIVQSEIDVLSWFNRQSEKVVLYLEPVARGHHQLPSIRNPCSRILPLGLSIVAEYASGCADGSESIVAWHVTVKALIS